MRWFVSLQLVEYTHLFQETEENAWLDRIDRRYTWIKKHLLSFEERMGRIFPADWDMSERIAVEFCNVTRNELSRLMAKRVNDIDVKLLLFTLQKTTQFEDLLSKRYAVHHALTPLSLINRIFVCLRFTGQTMQEAPLPEKTTAKKVASTNPFDEPTGKNPFEEDDDGQPAEVQQPSPAVNLVPATVSPFQGLISRCFETHLTIFVDGQDR